MLIPARTTPQVSVDWTKCFTYDRLVSEEIEHYSEIEVTEDLREGGVAANLAWHRWYEFLAASWKSSFVDKVVQAAETRPAPRLLSLGCGYGGMEIDCARRLRGDYAILALDVNENLFAQARRQVAQEGLHLEFRALDLNFVELEENSIDVAFAHAALHHLLNFEHVFEQVHRALRPGGRLVLLDIIGRTQTLFWPENVRYATELVRAMPRRYRKGLQIEPAALFGGYLDGGEQPGMEGIRQEELEEQIDRWFRPLEMHKYNAFVRLICMHPTIAPRFDIQRARDRAYLEKLFRLDLQQIASGALRATEMFAMYEKRAVPDGPLAAHTATGPKVSVCLAGDNSLAEVRSCWESVRAQTHRNIEAILLLPEAGGEVADWGREVSAQGGLRTVTGGRVDRGLDWRPALDAATGEYVALANSEDVWYPIKLAEQVAFLEADPRPGLTYSQMMAVDDRGRRSAKGPGGDVLGRDLGDAVRESLSKGEELPRSNALFRRSSWTSSPEAAGSSPLTEGALYRALAARVPFGFQPRILGLQRQPRPEGSDGEAQPDSTVAPSGPQPRGRSLTEFLRRFRPRKRQDAKE